MIRIASTSSASSLEVYYGDASRPDLLHAAGAEQAQLLILALDQSDKALQLVETAKKHYPHLKILARAHDRTEAYDLLDAGVDRVFRDKLDSSLKLGVDALRLLGFRAHQAHRAAQTFRRHDETALRELAEMRHDKKLYIGTARQKIEDLEELLLADLGDRDEMQDEGWDNESLRGEFGIPLSNSSEP